MTTFDTFELAEKLADRLQTTPNYISNDGLSWYILVKQWSPPTTQEEFDIEWALHPNERRKVKLFGKVFDERRWSQAWGTSMSYSGLEQIARPIEDSTMVPLLFKRVNSLMKDVMYLNLEDSTEAVGKSDTRQYRDRMKDREEKTRPPLYNACLQNWYEPNDIIGLHSDDESYLISGLPIFSLSWGGTRRFLFRSKKNKESVNKIELWLESGDLLIMGGTCQETHKHEVPKVRATMDPITSNRINWTIRGIK